MQLILILILIFSRILLVTPSILIFSRWTEQGQANKSYTRQPASWHLRLYSLSRYCQHLLSLSSSFSHHCCCRCHHYYLILFVIILLSHRCCSSQYDRHRHRYCHYCLCHHRNLSQHHHISSGWFNTDNAVHLAQPSSVHPPPAPTIQVLVNMSNCIFLISSHISGFSHISHSSAHLSIRRRPPSIRQFWTTRFTTVESSSTSHEQLWTVDQLVRGDAGWLFQHQILSKMCRSPQNLFILKSIPVWFQL